MKLFRWIVLCCMLSGSGVCAFAQSTVYRFVVPGPYQDVSNCFSPMSGLCQNYTTQMRAEGFFRTSAPLPPNLGNADIKPFVSGYAFNDGIRSFNQNDPESRVTFAGASTDAAGNLTALTFVATRWLSGTDPHANSDRVAVFFYSRGQVGAYSDAVCTSPISAPEGGANICQSVTTDGRTSAAAVQGVTIAVDASTASVAQVPTLSFWGLIALCLLLSLAPYARHWRTAGVRARLSM